MKDFHLLVWLTQLGLGVAVPLAGLAYLGMWLRQRFDLGVWVVLCCVAVGLLCAVSSLVSSLKTMTRMSQPKKPDMPPPLSYNDHD